MQKQLRTNLKKYLIKFITFPTLYIQYLNVKYVV